MFLNPADFNALLNHLGQRFLWRKSNQCPCLSPHSGAADPRCPVCNGKGRFWSAGVPGLAGVPSQKAMRNYATFGVWEDGDMLLSVPQDSPLYAMARFDRVVALDNYDTFTDVLTHGAADEKLRMAVTEITRVFWLDGADVVEGGLPTLNPDGTLTWAAGEPPAGKQYTIEGQKNVEYFCWKDLPSDRNEHQGALLPRRVQLRNFDLFGR